MRTRVASVTARAIETAALLGIILIINKYI